MRVSKEKFSILYLQSLADDFITGVDTPTSDARKLCSSLERMPWQTVLDME